MATMPLNIILLNKIFDKSIIRLYFSFIFFTLVKFLQIHHFFLKVEFNIILD